MQNTRIFQKVMHAEDLVPEEQCDRPLAPHDKNAHVSFSPFVSTSWFSLKEKPK